MNTRLYVVMGVSGSGKSVIGAAFASALDIDLVEGDGIPIVEGLSLERVTAGDYDMIVLPIKVAGHEGAPARAVLRKR